MNRVASVVILLLSVVLFLFSLAGNHGLLHLRNLEQEIHQLEGKTTEMKQETARIKNEIYGVQNSAEVLEQRSREELGMAKPNEIIYTFSGKPPEGPKSNDKK